ncbi:MAG: DUF3341 domain-containing protein [bacterium]|nr:DUF3341 domain-containing protein [bacterium]
MLKLSDIIKQIKPPENVPLMVGVFLTPEELYHAAEKAMDKGYKGVDAITPFPIHGLDEVLKIPSSWLPYATLIAGVSGSAFMLWFQWWTSSVNYPLNVGGKPLFSWPAFAPIVFEGGELLGGVTTFIVLLITAYLCRPRALIKNPLEAKFTDDTFALLIPISKENNQQDVETFLKGVGADEIRLLTV